MNYVKQNVDILKNIFTVVLALALGEAFKQFVTDMNSVKPDSPEPAIRWDRLPGLLAFLFLLTPFYQGMGRYLSHTYVEAQTLGRPEPYGRYLLIDCVLFALEAGLFFVMARALSGVHWRRFYWAVWLICVADGVWGIFVWRFQRPTLTSDILDWLKLDGIAFVVVSLMLWRLTDRDSKWVPWFGLALMMLRTFFDYKWSWHLYFP